VAFGLRKVSWRSKGVARNQNQFGLEFALNLCGGSALVAVVPPRNQVDRRSPLRSLDPTWTAGILLIAALVAWIVTVSRMQGMDAGPGTDLGGFSW